MNTGGYWMFTISRYRQKALANLIGPSVRPSGSMSSGLETGRNVGKRLLYRLQQEINSQRARSVAAHTPILDVVRRWHGRISAKDVSVDFLGLPLNIDFRVDANG